MHPPEDVSLEELRARHPRYQRKVPPPPATSTPSSSTPTSITSTRVVRSQTPTYSAVNAAHEVS